MKVCEHCEEEIKPLAVHYSEIYPNADETKSESYYFCSLWCVLKEELS